MKRGQIFIVSGPSGSGKSTVLHEVFKNRDKMWFSVSATTRAPRAGETEGVDYFFTDREKFLEMIERDELLEHAQFVGNFYGTPRGPIEAKLSEGWDVVLDIEVQGAAQVKAKIPEATSIFIKPPSFEVLEKRLRGRGTESEEKIAGRLERAMQEINDAYKYDYVVTNDEVGRAAAILRSIMEIITERK